MSAALVLFEDGTEYHKEAPTMDFGPLYTSDDACMTTFLRFCDQTGFGVQARAYIEAWHAEHGTAPVPAEPTDGNVDDASPGPIFMTDATGTHHKLVIQNANGERHVISFSSDDIDSSDDDLDEDEQLGIVTSI